MISASLPIMQPTNMQNSPVQQNYSDFKNNDTIVMPINELNLLWFTNYLYLLTGSTISTALGILVPKNNFPMDCPSLIPTKS